jgi:hypothetical protein
MNAERERKYYERIERERNNSENFERERKLGRERNNL